MFATQKSRINEDVRVHQKKLYRTLDGYHSHIGIGHFKYICNRYIKQMNINKTLIFNKMLLHITAPTLKLLDIGQLICAKCIQIFMVLKKLMYNDKTLKLIAQMVKDATNVHCQCIGYHMQYLLVLLLPPLQ